MSFSDFPFVPEAMGDISHDFRRFPSHTEVQAWLEVFAAKYNLRKHIKFNSQVTLLRPMPSANMSSNPDASAAVRTAPRWKLTVQQSPASTNSTQHAAQQASHTCDANGTLHANADTVDSPESMTQASIAEAPTTEPALQTSCNGKTFQNDSIPNSNDGVQPHNMTTGMSQQSGAAAVALPFTRGCSEPHNFEQSCDSQAQDASRDQQFGAMDAHASEQSHHEFDAVVVCVGNYHQPNLPEVQGIDDFPGLQMHAHNYRSAAMFTHQTVIVVGASFSGKTLSCLTFRCTGWGCSIKEPKTVQCCL